MEELQIYIRRAAFVQGTILYVKLKNKVEQGRNSRTHASLVASWQQCTLISSKAVILFVSVDS